MEIIEVSESDNTMALKAKGRQRCKIMTQAVNISFRMGKVTVKILPEIELSGPLQELQLPSLNKCRKSEQSFENLMHNNKFRKQDAAQLRFPLWVYNQYELHVLSKKIQIGLNAYSIGKNNFYFICTLQLHFSILITLT